MASFVITIVVTTIIVALLQYFVRLVQFIKRQRCLYESLKSIPGPEYRFSFWGNIPLLLEIARNPSGKADISIKFHNLLVQLCDQYGELNGIVRLWLGPFLPMLIICDVKVAQILFNSPHYMDKASFYSIFRLAIGDGVFTCNSSKLKMQKRTLRDHFKVRALEQYMINADRHLKVLNQRIETCIDKKGGIFFDVKELVSPFILDTLGENLFSTEFDAQHIGEPKFIQLVHKLLDIGYNAFLRPWNYSISNPFFRYVFNFSMIKSALVPIMRFQKSGKKIVQDRYQKIMLEHRINAGAEHKPTDHLSMLDSMITARLDQSKLTKLNEIDRQINTFIIAGHDTSTSSITWTLYLLGHHLKAQEKLRDEIDAFIDEINSNGEPISLINIKKLKYLDSCIKESLRLYPSGPFIGRRGRQPVKINDELTLPADINVILFIQYMQTREKYFRKATEFIPERWMMDNGEIGLEESESDTTGPWVTNSAMMPFSSGLRVCIGKDYGIVQQKLFFINLFRRYSIKAMDKYGTSQPKRFFLLSPSNFPIKLQRRNDSGTHLSN